MRLTAREITLIRVALLTRLSRIKEEIEEGTGLSIEEDAKDYEEIKVLLAKLWDMRKGLTS